MTPKINELRPFLFSRKMKNYKLSFQLFVALFISFLSIISPGCDGGEGELLGIVNSTKSDFKNVAIAFIKSNEIVEPGRTKIADLDNTEFRYRSGYLGSGKDTSYGYIHEMPARAFLEWTEDGEYFNCLVEVPVEIEEYFDANRKRKDGNSKELTFEILPNRTVEVYLKLTQEVPLTRNVTYFPPRTKDE